MNADRLTAALTAAKFAALSEHPDRRAWAIASHYCGYINAALALHRLAQVRRHIGPDPKIDPYIERLVAKISDGHREDLGLALEWPTLTSGASPHVENFKGKGSGPAAGR